MRLPPRSRSARPVAGPRVLPVALALVALVPLVAVAPGFPGRDGVGLPGAQAADAPPAITVAEPTFDFGKVPEGGVIRHVFKVKNSGGSPLEIKSVSAACGCTAAALKEKVIAPGRTGEIEVKFDTRNRPGKNDKTVTVVSNDPKTPTLSLLIRAEVEQMLGLQPAYSQVGTGGPEPATAEIWLSGKLAPRARLRVARMDPKDSPTRVEVIERTTDAGKQKGLRVSVAGGSIGQGGTKIYVATGVPQLPEVEHVVLWSLRGNLEVPRQVHLDLTQPASREKVIQVTSRRPDFRLTAARVLDGPFVATVIESKGPARSIKLTSKLTSPPAALTTGKLVLESNDPLEPKKEIPLSLAAKP